MIISPWTRRGDNPDGGAIDDNVYEFSSVLRFIEELHELKPMTERDGTADPPGRVRLHARAAPRSVDPRATRLPELVTARRTLIVLLAPLVLAAGDPSGDVASCPSVEGRAGGDAPDLVEATGEIVELGTSVRFTLRFAEPLHVPDGEGRPFRVDIVVFDPDVPAVDAGLYRHVNRILRYDAVRDPVTTTLLLPEAGQSRFIPSIDGDTLMIQVPGRTLTADEDETGTRPASTGFGGSGRSRRGGVRSARGWPADRAHAPRRRCLGPDRRGRGRRAA